MDIKTISAAFGVLAFAISSAAAAEGDQFVIGGDATKVLMEQNEISVATAEAIGRACVDEAVAQGVRVSIAIYDQFGEPVYMYRMDGQTKIAIETAMMKARTVLNTRQPSKAVMNQVLSGRASELRQYSFGNLPIPAAFRSSSTAGSSSAPSASAARRPSFRSGATKSAPGAHCPR